MLRLTAIPTSALMLEALAISVTYGISAYDACYVSLSQQNNVPLLTQDQKLVNLLEGADLDIQLFSDFAIPPVPLTS